MAIAQYPIHRQQDALVSTTINLGDNNVTTSTNAIDVQAAKLFPSTGRLTAVVITTLGNGANTKNVNITIQHSAVNIAANFANIPELAPVTIAANANYPATQANYALPPSTLQFLRLLCITENTGGNPSNGTATLRLQF